MSDALEAIRARHNDIEQDALPLDIPDTGARRHEGRVEKSIGQALCPWHTDRGDDQTTGLIRGADGLIFREHTKRVGRTTVRCPGSGKAPTTKEDTP